MKSLNKVTLIGHLGKDPELKHTPSGVPVASFSIATNRVWKDDSGTKQEKTDWHNIIAWRKLAEICSEYLKKGSKVYLEGRLETECYEKEGKKVYVTKVIAGDLIMLDSKNVSNSGNNTSEVSQVPENPDDLPF